MHGHMKVKFDMVLLWNLSPTLFHQTQQTGSSCSVSDLHLSGGRFVDIPSILNKGFRDLPLSI
jgi:hypothetical protein